MLTECTIQNQFRIARTPELDNLDYSKFIWHVFFVFNVREHSAVKQSSAHDAPDQEQHGDIRWMETENLESNFVEFQDEVILYSMPMQVEVPLGTFLAISFWGKLKKTWCHISVSSVKTDLVISRFCQHVDITENLKTLCQCTGSIAKYHVSWMEKWPSVSKIDICELCHQHFATKRKPRPFSEVCITFKQG